MRRLCFSILLGTIWTLAGCQAQGPPTGKVGDQPRRFVGKTDDGQYIQLEDYAGKVVLLNVWASWCPPCKKELPELQRLHRRYEDDGFMVLGVSIDKPNAFGAVEQLKATYGLTYPMVLDPDGKSTTTFEVSVFPTSLLLGRDSTIVYRRQGPIKIKDEPMIAAIEAALKAPATK